MLQGVDFPKNLWYVLYLVVVNKRDDSLPIRRRALLTKQQGEYTYHKIGTKSPRIARQEEKESASQGAFFMSEALKHWRSDTISNWQTHNGGASAMKIDDFKTLDSLRAGIMKDLDELPPGKQLSTTEMVEYVMAKSGAEPGTKFLSVLLYDAARRRPYVTFPGYTTPGTRRPGASHFTKGKMVTPVLWHCRTVSETGVTCPRCHGTGVTGLDTAATNPVSGETRLEEPK